MLIEFADKDDMKSISECILNALRGNITLTPKTYAKLKKHKTVLRYLINKRVNNKKRKAALKQKGGFLPLLIPLAVSLLGGLAKKVIG